MKIFACHKKALNYKNIYINDILIKKYTYVVVVSKHFFFFFERTDKLDPPFSCSFCFAF